MDDLVEAQARGSRAVNAAIRAVVPAGTRAADEPWDFVCECGHCHEVLQLQPAEFDRLVSGDELVVASGHAFGAAREARRVARTLRLEAQALQAQARQAVRQTQRLASRGDESA